MIELLLEAERALSMGRADRAELLYRQVAAADPRNSIAVVGLARVALERADDAGALVMARRALAIDGQNVAAQRLIQRLEEVLVTRGEALPPAEVAPAPAGVAPAPAEETPGATQVAPASAEVAPAAADRTTPIDGPDPVLAPVTTSRPGLASPGAGPATRPGLATPEPAPAERRSLLDRFRRR